MSFRMTAKSMPIVGPELPDASLVHSRLRRPSTGGGAALAGALGSGGGGAATAVVTGTLAASTGAG